MIDDQLSEVGAWSIVPPKKFNNKDFQHCDNAKNQKVANLRIHVEQAFGRVKMKCKALGKVHPLSSIDLFGRIFAVCANLMNYKVAMHMNRV